MEEESNPVKDYLFDYVNNSETIPQLISEKKFDKVINEKFRSVFESGK